MIPTGPAPMRNRKIRAMNATIKISINLNTLSRENDDFDCLLDEEKNVLKRK
jgi:hypothetical protein